MLKGAIGKGCREPLVEEREQFLVAIADSKRQYLIIGQRIAHDSQVERQVFDQSLANELLHHHRIANATGQLPQGLRQGGRGDDRVAEWVVTNIILACISCHDQHSPAFEVSGAGNAILSRPHHDDPRHPQVGHAEIKKGASLRSARHQGQHLQTSVTKMLFQGALRVNGDAHIPPHGRQHRAEQLHRETSDMTTIRVGG